MTIQYVGEGISPAPMASRVTTIKKRNRLDPESRRQQLIVAATALVLKHEILPLPMAELSHDAEVSKALIYSYFPTQQELINAALKQQFQALDAAGLNQISTKTQFEDIVLAYADLYFSHVARSGPLIHIVFRDHYMAGHIDQWNRQFRERIARKLIRLGRKKLKLSAKEAVAAFNLILTIPEEAGRLAFRGELKSDRARTLSHGLIKSALRGVTPAPK